ncbi:DUF6658 family protein [Nostoc sp. CCY0012]|uniref:DUF6658 family protein n=1 Tax=Nostoc sp. CCY0012 TaxID=1056123 RepID=UPI0039C6593F
MNSVIAFWKKLKLRQILTIFMAGLLLIVTTACSGANPQGANPNNPAVQAGGANNPYKNGGDNYTKYHMTTDPKVIDAEGEKGNNRASLQSDFSVLIAAHKDSGILYPGAETPAGRLQKERELPIITEKDFQRPEAGGFIQREPSVGTRIQERIETVQDSVQEASDFLTDKAEEASNRPELQPNPAVRR